MVWFSLHKKPSRGVHWDIHFCAVFDERGQVMESTYMIVITVARCPGGVSVSEPESYHLVNGVVTRMDLKTWTARFRRRASCCQRPNEDELNQLSNLQIRHIERSSWSSHGNRNLFHRVNGVLIRLINAGFWDEFWAKKELLEKENSSFNMIKLVVMLNEITALYKLGHFYCVEPRIKDYESLLSKSTVDANINEARLHLLKSCVQKYRGNIKKSYEEADKGLAIVDQLPTGIVVGEYYCHLAAVITILLQNETDRDQCQNLTSKAVLFSQKAIMHLKDAKYCDLSKFDQLQKAHINLAFLYLQSSFMNCAKPEILLDNKELEKAKISLNAVNEFINEGYPLTDYRKCQYYLARSMLFYRLSQNVSIINDRNRQREQAKKFSKKAESRATNCEFKSIMECSQKYLAMLDMYS
ncbi:uncharacterized protein LOC124436223 [Xenia sp. Carnegie-2017]|uniref:uncharacterized protein LOC124436223 n=1 Tax=Xenia sp. Carnegie-2017 TaxID=2897299 RepID=UPI001F048BB6|nr:uncharacterized protein LOC124436223 [Xenia sp. Carnegie-2017]